MIKAISAQTKVWKDYCVQLFQDTPDVSPEDHIEELESVILREEVERAIRRLRNQMSPKTNWISVEDLKGMVNWALTCFTLCVRKSGNRDTGRNNGVNPCLFKKGLLLECENYHTIALISPANKVMLTIMNETLFCLLPQVPNEKTGVVQGKRIREQILIVRQFNVKIILCCVDFKKAFNKVRWPKLWGILLEMGTPRHLVHLIR